MKIFCNKIFALVLLSVINNSLDYNQSRNGQGENSFHEEKTKNLQFLQKCSFRLI